MNRDPWLHFWGTSDPSGRTAMVECLNTAGIRHRVFDQSAESGDGILCIPQISEPQASADVCEFLRELTQNGRRVLTIQTDGAAVDTSLVWQLLHAGASDVLVWSSAADTAARIKARFERWNAIDAVIQSPEVEGQADWRQQRVARIAAPDRRGGPFHLRLRAADRRERHRQGTDRAPDP